MILVTSEEMQRIDRYAIDVLEIPEIVLMENAALKVISNIDTNLRNSFAVICGTGNNGGDGLAVARGLIALGKSVDVYIIGDYSKSSQSFKMNLRALKNLTESIHSLETIGDIQELPGKLNKVNMIIDAIFGTGLTSQVKGMAEYVIDTMNKSRIYTLSIDLPSGLNGDSGEIMGICVDPSYVVCLQAMKVGLKKNSILRPDIKVETIGIPQKAFEVILGRDYAGRSYFSR